MAPINTNVYSIIYTVDENGLPTYTMRMAHPKVPDLVLRAPPTVSAETGGFIDRCLMIPAADLLEPKRHDDILKQDIVATSHTSVNIDVHAYYNDKLSELADLVSRSYVKDAPAIVERLVNILKGAKS